MRAVYAPVKSGSLVRGRAVVSWKGFGVYRNRDGGSSKRLVVQLAAVVSSLGRFSRIGEQRRREWEGEGEGRRDLYPHHFLCLFFGGGGWVAQLLRRS